MQKTTTKTMLTFTTNFYKKMKKTFIPQSIIITFSVLILSFSSCTNVDKTIGVGMIPDESLVTLVTDTIYPSLYNVTLDSVMVKDLQYNSFGSYFDPILGTVTAGMAFQFYPAYDSIDFGTTHIIDSIVLQMNIDSRTGEDSYNQTLQVYELSELLYIDSVYYTCMPANTVINSTPIATHQYMRTPKDRWDVSDTVRIRLANSFGDRLLAAPLETMLYDSIHLFYEYFKGLYITSDVVAPGTTGRMNRVPLSTSDIRLLIHYKRDGVDTTCTYYHYLSNGTLSLTLVEHDYTTATHPLKVNTASLNDTARTTSLDSTLYIQGLFGITPMMKIRHADIQNWLTAKNLNAKDLTISRVMFEVDIERFAGYELEKLATPMGLFYKSYERYSDDAEMYPHISSINELNSTMFGGTLNTSWYKYPMKITYDFTSLIKNFDAAKSAVMYLAPYTQLAGTSYYGQTIYSYIAEQSYLFQTLIKGSSSSQPPRLIISYAKPKY